MLLSLNNIEVVYDRVFLAVKSVSIDVPEGGLVALLGANGAGKSTTLKSVSGLLKPERGEVTRGEIAFSGQDLLDLAPPERVRAGIVHVLEGRRVFGQLTPEENLLAATSMHRDRAHVRHLMERTFAWFPRLTERARTRSGYLSGGEQQMLAIGRALMTEPKLLLLDEPSLGLAPFLVDEIFDKYKAADVAWDKKPTLKVEIMADQSKRGLGLENVRCALRCRPCPAASGSATSRARGGRFRRQCAPESRGRPSDRSSS